jgi:two-component system osmolarity sensor histidine kinase EnvZ
MVISVVNLTRAAVLSADPSLRTALLAELAEAEGIRVFPADPEDGLTSLPQDVSGSALTQNVREKLGSNTRFAAARNGQEGFWVSFFIGTDEFWVALPSERLSAPPVRQWLGSGLLVLVLALTGGALIARQVGRPLAHLAKATEALGRGEIPPRVPESGAVETAAVAGAFNRMAADLAVLEKERTLVLAGISHDLRTPLTRLRLAAEFVAEEANRTGMIRDLEEMDAILAQFLDYARLGAQEAPEPTDIGCLLEEVAALCRNRCRELIVRIDASATMMVRPLLMKRALTNLVENAIRHGGGQVEMHLVACADRVEMRVQDRGPGIPAERLESVKRPFVRLEASRPGSGGTGLGLAIVEQAARLHGGEFSLTPRPGGGLVASIILDRGSPRSGGGLVDFPHPSEQGN